MSNLSVVLQLCRDVEPSQVQPFVSLLVVYNYCFICLKLLLRKCLYAGLSSLFSYILCVLTLSWLCKIFARVPAQLTQPDCLWTQGRHSADITRTLKDS